MDKYIIMNRYYNPKETPCFSFLVAGPEGSEGSW